MRPPHVRSRPRRRRAQDSAERALQLRRRSPHRACTQLSVVASNSSRSLRCSSVRRRGTETFSRICRVAVAEAPGAPAFPSSARRARRPAAVLAGRSISIGLGERLDRHGDTECRLHDRQVDRSRCRFLTHETWVVAHVDEHVDIACPCAKRTRHALRRRHDPLATRGCPRSRLRVSRDSSVRPAPSQALHGCSTSTPRPRQRTREHADEVAEHLAEEICCRRPAPSHWGARGRVSPGLDAVSLQTVHCTAAS